MGLDWAGWMLLEAIWFGEQFRILHATHTKLSEFFDVNNEPKMYDEVAIGGEVSFLLRNEASVF